MGLLFRLVKLTRAIRIFFGGYKGMEEKHKLFQLPEPLTPRQIHSRLVRSGYQYNSMSTTYKKQIWTMRKLVDIDHQIHLRFYSDGWISGHYELQPEMWPTEHLRGKDLRPLNRWQVSRIKELIKGSDLLRRRGFRVKGVELAL